MAALLEHKVKDFENGKTVEQLLRSHFAISSTVLKSLKENKKIFLNGKHCRNIDLAKTNDVILADVSDNVSDEKRIKPFKSDLNVIFEDDFILLVNKPGGIESHPCASNRESSLANIVMYYWSKKGEEHNYHIVNRLDKGTSGICVIAKNSFAHGCLSEQSKNGLFKKNYMAVVHGVPDPLKGEISLPIGRSSDSIIKREVRPDGKPASTLYEVISSNSEYSLVKILLKTGRTHQIRVHFSKIGHPLVGDWLYGNGDNEKHLIKRQALHAGDLEFFHPVSKERLKFNAEIPDEMKKLILTES